MITGSTDRRRDTSTTRTADGNRNANVGWEPEGSGERRSRMARTPEPSSVQRNQRLAQKPAVTVKKAQKACRATMQGSGEGAKGLSSLVTMIFFLRDILTL